MLLPWKRTSPYSKTARYFVHTLFMGIQFYLELQIFFCISQIICWFTAFTKTENKPHASVNIPRMPGRCLGVEARGPRRRSKFIPCLGFSCLPWEWARKSPAHRIALKWNQQHSLAVSLMFFIQFSSVTQSYMTLWPHGLQHDRLPCPSPTPTACSNWCPWSQWCHPTISSSVVPFSSRLQSFPASASLPMSQFFASGGQVLKFQLQHQSFQWIFRTNFI